MIEVIVSDLGQVILPFDTTPFWKAMSMACPDDTTLRATFGRVVRQSEIGLGRIEPDAFHARLVEEIGLGLSYDEFRLAWCDVFWEDPETIDLMMRAPIRERHILSNTNVIHWEWIERRHASMIRRFDRCWLSHEMGLEKPDPAIYRRVMDATGLPAKSHVYIDDLPENVDAARRLGMHGIVHLNAALLRREFEAIGLT